MTTPDLAPPSAPTGLAETAADAPPRVALSWSAASDDVGVTAYEVSRGGALVATVTATSWTDTSVAAGQTYDYAVRPRDAAGNQGPEASVTAKVPDTTAPRVPTALRASALSKPRRVSLSWGASTDNVGVAGYRVFRNGVRIATTATRSYVDAAVARSTTYRYAVAAHDAAGNASATTASVSVKTPAK